MLPAKPNGMAFSELIAALRTGQASVDVQRHAADLLQSWRPKRGRPRKLYWQNANKLIAAVEERTATLGSRKLAFEALAENKRPESVERQYRAAKAWEKAEEEWIDAVFSEFVEGDKK